MFPHQTSAFTIAAFLVVTATGCSSSFNLKDKLPWMNDDSKKVVESKFEKPARLVAIWTPAVYTTAGKPPMRGLGGRLYFYNAANKAIPVEGQLVVYGFDNNKPQDTHDPNKADVKVTFAPEQFTQHFSETDLGASYSVWVPWEEVGGPTLEVSLLPIFTSSNGAVLIGQQSKHNLPGADAKKEVSAGTLTPFANSYRPQSQPANGVQQVSYQQPAPQTSVVETASISLPPELARRMAGPAPTAADQQPTGPISKFGQATVVYDSLTPRANATPQTATSVLPQPPLPSSPSPGRVPEPWSPPDPRSTRYARPPHQAPSTPAPQPARDRTQWQPGPITPPSLHPSTPQSVPPSTPAAS